MASLKTLWPRGLILVVGSSFLALTRSLQRCVRFKEQTRIFIFLTVDIRMLVNLLLAPPSTWTGLGDLDPDEAREFCNLPEAIDRALQAP